MNALMHFDVEEKCHFLAKDIPLASGKLFYIISAGFGEYLLILVSIFQEGGRTKERKGERERVCLND